MHKLYFFGLLFLLAGIATIVILTGAGLLVGHVDVSVRTVSARCPQYNVSVRTVTTRCPQYNSSYKCTDTSPGCNQIASNISGYCLLDLVIKVCAKTCGCCAHWTDWGSWQSNTSGLLCVQLRYRQCSTGNVSHCGDERQTWDIKMCDKLSSNDWEHWSTWHCQLGFNSTCSMSRFRQCRLPLQDCIGNSTEIFPCTQDECPHHFGVRINCSLFESSNYPCTETPGCKDLIQIPDRVCPLEILRCPISCGCCDPSLAVVSSYTTTTTQASLSSFTMTITPFRSDSSTSTFPLTQFSTTATEMQSTTSTKITISTETSIQWGEWGYWRCKTEDHGKCVMFRTRNCTEGDIINCSTLNESIEFTECKQQICKDLVNLTRCANYSDSVSHCTEEASSCPGLNPSSQACNNVNIASSICPKSCGCCENEIEGYSVWESWSSWTCEILKSDLSSTCHMYRSRQCLSGNPADCHGLPFETTECHYSDCLGAGITHVNCSLFNRSSTCEDHAECKYFADKPWQFCSNAAFVAKCPQLCTCCGENVDQCIDISAGCAVVSFNRVEYCKQPSITELCPKTCGFCDNGLAGFAQWENWSTWKCKLGLNGTCTMSRYRNCSTSVQSDCKGDHSQIEECTKQECPGLYGFVADCSAFDSTKSTCIDNERCGELFKVARLVCTVETHLCPVICGCCDNGLAGFTQWENWSTWKCKLGFNGTCFMSRYRNCSTSVQSDCKGDHSQIEECTKQECPGLYGFVADCSSFDSTKSTCIDREHCGELFNVPRLVCTVETHLCPVICGCCENTNISNQLTTEIPPVTSAASTNLITNGISITPTGNGHISYQPTTAIPLVTTILSTEQRTNSIAMSPIGNEHIGYQPSTVLPAVTSMSSIVQGTHGIDSTAIPTVTGTISGQTTVIVSSKSTQSTSTLLTTTITSSTIGLGTSTKPDIFGVCNFDNGTICSWTQSNEDSFDWKLQSGPTPTDGTGPNNDHTLQTSQGIYLFIETSTPRFAGEQASILSPELPADHTVCLEFWYYMFGNGIGSLLVHAEDTHSKNVIQLFKKDGDQGESWFKASVTIFSKQIPNNYRLVITANVGLSYLGDTAIDDLALHDGECQDPSSHAAATSSGTTEAVTSTALETTTGAHTTHLQITSPKFALCNAVNILYTAGNIANVALGKPVVLSSQFDTISPGTLMVDGIRSNTYPCACTAFSTDPHAVVDLGQTYAIKFIFILNRHDCCPERLHDFDILIGDTPTTLQNVIHYPRAIDVDCTFEVPAGTSGRYVKIQILGSNEILTVCEFEVYA